MMEFFICISSSWFVKTSGDAENEEQTLASAVAAIPAAMAASSTPSKDERMAKTGVAVASTATLVVVQERQGRIGICGKGTTITNNNNSNNTSTSDGGEILNGENFLGVCSQELLAKGSELLKQTRKVSVYIHRIGQVMLKMKSRHVAGSITKKKKNAMLDICRDLLLLDDGEKWKYFGLKTDARGIVEIECRNQGDYDIWTQGVSRLLSIVAQRQNRFEN
ncbi:hypothetical protein AHAS_Ahas02G0242600 [Arachis hypogaea]